MRQLNNNTFGKIFQNRHWEKLYFLKNTLGKIHGVTTEYDGSTLREFEKQKRVGRESNPGKRMINVITTTFAVCLDLFLSFVFITQFSDF